MVSIIAYMTAGGWTSSQLFKHNYLYGYDFTEQYVDIYTPSVAEGMIVRIGRWIACPDIETQFAPDNYMGSHSFFLPSIPILRQVLWQL